MGCLGVTDRFLRFKAFPSSPYCHRFGAIDSPFQQFTSFPVCAVDILFDHLLPLFGSEPVRRPFIIFFPLPPPVRFSNLGRGTFMSIKSDKSLSPLLPTPSQSPPPPSPPSPTSLVGLWSSTSPGAHLTASSDSQAPLENLKFLQKFADAGHRSDALRAVMLYLPDTAAR